MLNGLFQTTLNAITFDMTAVYNVHDKVRRLTYMRLILNELKPYPSLITGDLNQLFERSEKTEASDFCVLLRMKSYACFFSLNYEGYAYAWWNRQTCSSLIE